MTADRRFLFANADVAHADLEGRHPAPRYLRPVLHRITAPVVALCRSPGGGRDKDLLFGQPFEVLDTRDGWSFGADVVDGYVGYIPATASAAQSDSVTHRVTSRASHVYSAPDIKSPETASLSFFSALAVTGQTGDFHALATGGFVPRQHVAPLSWRADDAVDLAQMFMGTPYLWGGNSAFGIDCSGLVQMCLYGAGRACPRDSDLQAGEWQSVTRRADLKRGDLVFWKGHVGMMMDNARLIHANAHHMAVAIEPLDQAITRIAAKEFGAVTRMARP